MKNKKVLIAIALILLSIILISFGLIIQKENPNQESKRSTYPEEIISQTSDEITYSLLKFENAKDNLIYSPLSIKYALNMLNYGADKETKKQIEQVLGESKIPNYEDIKNKLSIANAIFIRKDFKSLIKNEFIDNNKKNLNAEIKYDSFKNVDNINKWVKQKTLDLIPKMLKNEDLDPDLRIILTNALAIKMDWEKEFDFNDTTGRTFYKSDGSSFKATTMTQTAHSDSISYYTDENTTALAMDLKKYSDTQLEFVAIMPKDLNDYIKTVNSEEIEKVTSKLIKSNKAKEKINIYIPKYKFEYDLELTEDLKKLGIEDVFDVSKANLKKISNENLYVSKIKHKSTIDFSEKGIKASAVTMVFVDNIASSIDKTEKLDIVINKPFMFIIRDKNSKEVWFVGTVYEPNSWDKDYSSYK